jgi:hypothetical protein
MKLSDVKLAENLYSGEKSLSFWALDNQCKDGFYHRNKHNVCESVEIWFMGLACAICFSKRHVLISKHFYAYFGLYLLNGIFLVFTLIGILIFGYWHALLSLYGLKPFSAFEPWLFICMNGDSPCYLILRRVPSFCDVYSTPIRWSKVSLSLCVVP